MKTIILPGYSPGNKDWAEAITGKINLGHKVIVHNWRHWQTGAKNLSPKKEVETILKEIGSHKVNILAKSVGTMVAMHILLKINNQVKKIILCGIPTVSEGRKGLFQKALVGFPEDKIICFQNRKDPWATYNEVKEFMRQVNPKISVIEKPRGDHHYPYSEDFQKFIVS